jgi:hypothetical protein
MATELLTISGPRQFIHMFETFFSYEILYIISKYM